MQFLRSGDGDSCAVERGKLFVFNAAPMAAGLQFNAAEVIP
jgi:hypothetical protein